MRPRRLLAVMFAAIMVAAPAAASETDVTYIDGIVQEAIDARIADDAEAYEAAKAEAYATFTDTVTPASCRSYLDASLVGLTLIEHEDRYPGSASAQRLFEFVLQAMPTFRNDCLLAI